MRTGKNELDHDYYIKVLAKITELQMLESMGEDHAEELKKLKKKIEYEEY